MRGISVSVKPLYNRSIYSPWKLTLAYQLSRPKPKTIPFGGKRVLLCNTGRLGDVFILTQMLPRLSNSEVSLLIAPEGKAAANGCPGIKSVHVIDPWYRSSDSKQEKWRKWRGFCKEAKARQEEFASYDTVFFSNPHFCGLTRLFPGAYTIGFDSQADRSHFSHIIPWNPHAYLAKVYEEVLDAFEFDPGLIESPWKQLVNEPLISGKYVVMHIGASDKSKDYTAKMWRRVYEELKEQGHQVVFTGKGQGDLIEAVTSNPEENLCDKLSWLELLRVIAHSQLVISVDTVALHIAAAFKRPLIALYRDAPDGATWRPQ